MALWLFIGILDIKFMVRLLYYFLKPPKLKKRLVIYFLLGEEVWGKTSLQVKAGPLKRKETRQGLENSI